VFFSFGERYVNRILRKMVVALQSRATTRRKRSKKAWTKWRRLISEQMRSGKSVAAFRRERKLCAPDFYWWKKQLRENTTVRFLEVQLAESPANLAGDSRIEVRLQNRRSLMVGRGFDPDGPANEGATNEKGRQRIG
jgi:hypothetical protein